MFSIAGISPYDSLPVSRSHSDPLMKGDSLILLPPIPSSKSTRRMKQISFDDYHMFWKDLATSVPGTTAISRKTKNSPAAGTHTCTTLFMYAYRYTGKYSIIRSHIILSLWTPDIIAYKRYMG